MKTLFSLFLKLFYKMGIKYLNRYLKRNCNHGIEYVTINKLRGKTIVVDTSIYMYKFLEEDSLLENFFVMITHFREHDITPLFIFDGKADASKMELLWKRVIKKRNALREYEKLKETIERTVEKGEKKLLFEKMEICRKNATRIKDQDLVELKQLFDAMGVYYYVAEMEADIVCAYFVKKGFAWACMSDDMDMFAYGCNFVLREWNVLKNTGLLYDRNQIMKEVRVESPYFTPLLLLMGTDYNNQDESIHVHTAFKWYDEYRKNAILKTIEADVTFYHWLENTARITPENGKKLAKIQDMYIIPEHIETGPNPIEKTNINWTVLSRLLSPHGYVI